MGEGSASEDLTENLTQMGPGTQQSWIVMHDQINRNVLHVASEAPFIFKPAAEARGFKEVEEARYDPARDRDRTRGAPSQR